MNDTLRWNLADADSPQLSMFPDARREVGIGEYRGLEFYEVMAKTIINKVPGPPRFGFQYSVNPYRGCSHACTYCFARPTHEYLGLNAAEDFDSKIIVKINAVERLTAEIHPSKWGGDLIALGTNTDPYQRAEGKYRLTRGIVATLTEHNNRFSVLTKNSLAIRDLDLFAEAARKMDIRVDFSIGTFDEDVWRLTEPGTPHPRKRMEAVAKLNEAGVPSGVLMGPVIPGLSDDPAQLQEVAKAAVEAGAVSLGTVLLHVKPALRDHFLSWIETERPELLPRYRRLYGSKSFVPDGMQKRVSQMVHQFAEQAGGLRTYRRHRPQTAQVAPTKPAAEQLRLIG
ncbi:MAG: radical SAM protein [Acidimicrobiia bacterium]|nr:radical SAM protein [Acidimicrobiia bacterium]